MACMAYRRRGVATRRAHWCRCCPAALRRRAHAWACANHRCTTCDYSRPYCQIGTAENSRRRCPAPPVTCASDLSAGSAHPPRAYPFGRLSPSFPEIVTLFDSAFPRQRPKSPREQRFAAVVSDGDHLLQPEPLVLTARVEQMDWDHHSVLQHPVDVRLGVSRALLNVHVGQAEAVEEDDG